ncbi:hypothetical protein EJ04DRAFT_504218 [Polyplosphaeria fusca]|uniref:Elongator complex protein 5 n=1 Tax=Polyplosphaeria fusca TaxID=682080 RepID=A0A9P4QP66_9PLEO|nr:hypothetical protein EJ04DRAFT_504218 [Polyplosphaeria fusca]
MGPTTKAQHERHSILQLSNVLNLRNAASPFTIILDSLHQPASPLVAEMIIRGLSRKTNIVYVSFERKFSHPALHTIQAWTHSSPTNLLSAISTALNPHPQSLVLIDSLYDLLVDKQVDLNDLFQLIAVKHSSSIVGIYHTELQPPPHDAPSTYAPTPLETLKYTATTILTCASFAQVLEEKRARERSVAVATTGLLSEAEGVVQPLTAPKNTSTPTSTDISKGIVIHAEFRRRSGRSETESFFLRRSAPTDFSTPSGALLREFAILLSRHPSFQSLPHSHSEEQDKEQEQQGGGSEMNSTFKLDLTDKQRAARENVVLPYFDAQREGGVGEGGRILYEMGWEDDFDEEEDEI